MKSPLNAIINPTRYRALLRGQTLDSVLVKTYSKWESIAVVNWSVTNVTLKIN